MPEGGYKEFLITDIFNVCNTHNILSSEVRLGSGKIPYLTAGESNNSIAGYIDYNPSLIEKGNVVFIGGKTMTVTYQENDFFSNDSHNLILTPKPGIKSTKRCQLFYVTSIKKSLSHKYHWGNSISKAKIQSDTISLPIDKNGEIDFDFMESRIRELEAYLSEAGFDNCELSQIYFMGGTCLFRFGTVGINADSPKKVAQLEDFINRLYSCGFIDLIGYDKHSHPKYKLNLKAYNTFSEAHSDNMNQE